MKVYYHLGGYDVNGTNLAHVCADFSVCIFFYNSILSQLCQELAWGNPIPNSKYMY